MLTPEQLRSFVTDVDGETRPDLVPFSTKFQVAISDHSSLERFKDVSTPSDNELMDAFRSGTAAARQADANIIDEMYRDLCERIDGLDAESIAMEIKRLDNVQIERQEVRARAFLESLTPAAASVLLSEAERLGRSVRGANNDVVALARQHPDFLKERVKGICAARGFLPNAPR